MCSPVPYYNHSQICAYLHTFLSNAGHTNLQDKVDTLQDQVKNLDDKLGTFQNTTEASTRKHHHEVVELLQNTSCSSDGEI